MATYTIVSSTASPLGPGEINAGTAITVAEGDIFIVDPSADADINFSDGGTATNFTLQFNATNANAFNVTVGGSLEPTIDIATGSDLTAVNIDSSSTDGMTLTAGDGVSLGALTGSSTLGDTITIGNNFTTTQDIDLNNGDNVVAIGHDASIANLFTGGGADNITFGDRANFTEVDSNNGNDTLWFGDDLVGNLIMGGNDDDWIRVGANPTLVTVIDGHNGIDTLQAQSAAVPHVNFENVNIVCFAAGCLIAKASGDRPVERLRPGDLVRRLDGGFAVLRWVGRFRVSREELAEALRLRPIQVAPGSLGPDVPRRKPVISPQHRILVRSAIVERMCGEPEVLVAAEKLLSLPGVDRQDVTGDVTYFHLLFDRHEILIAEGAATESMFLGEQTLKTLTEVQRRSIADCLPGRGALSERHRPARAFFERKRAIDPLIERHRKNRKPFQRGAMPESW